MSLTIKEIEKLARLARLDLTVEAKEKYSQDISSILQYVSKLQEIKIDESLESAELEAALRPDQVIGLSSKEQEALIKMAPETENNLIKTKPVF